MTVLGDARLDQQPIVQNLMGINANSKVLGWANIRAGTDTPNINFTVPDDGDWTHWNLLIGSWMAGYATAGFNAISVALDSSIYGYHRIVQNQAGWKPYAPFFTVAPAVAPGLHNLALAAWTGKTTALANATWSYFILGTPDDPNGLPRETKGSLGVRGQLGTFDLRDPLLLSDVAPSRFMQCSTANTAAENGSWLDTRKNIVMSGQTGRNTLVIVNASAYNTTANVFAVLGCYLRRTDNNAVHADMGLSWLGFNEASTHHAFPPFIWYGELPSQGVQAAVRVGASTSSDANDCCNVFAIHGV